MMHQLKSWLAFILPAIFFGQVVFAKELPKPIECRFEGVEIHFDFPSARVNGCFKDDSGALVIQTAPEDEPINPSPWYAFKIVADKTQVVQLKVESLGSPDAPYTPMARYTPRVSTDLLHWEAKEAKKEDPFVIFELEVDPTPLYVAGQELFTNQDYLRWLDKIAVRSNGLLFNLGQSAQSRPLPALLLTQPENTEWLILIGRQHPPELTGAMALRAFVEEMLNAGSLKEDFFSRYNVLLAPNLNPDGVALGHWRHSTGGGDLNRDWAARTQPETRALHDFLQAKVAAGDRLVYAVDFHSTWNNVYYTIPADYLTIEPNFSTEWLNLLASQVPYEVTEKPGSSPGRGIFKQYMADNYGIHSVTYEVGDETDRFEIKETARAAARTLMTYMLARPD